LYEEALNPESAKDSVRYREGSSTTGDTKEAAQADGTDAP
jgi:hypothetical protein